MAMSAFKKAERKHSKLRLALAGPAGSGKTLSALKIAKGMAQTLGCKVAVIDTEKGSSNLYAHVCDFDVLEFNAPYDPARYVSAIKLAEKEGYGIIIIDSGSHEWNGEGGCLQMVDKITQADKNHNSYMAWNTITPKHVAFIEAILQSPAHIICTLRSKTAYELVKDERTGRTKPVKLGLAPITREGMDFEFTTWLDLFVENHLATSSKDRTGMFDGVPELITEETGQKLLGWLNNEEGDRNEE
jgi:hypothetical protein